MYLNTLKVGLRRLVRERTYAAIAVLSLSTGIASFVILAVYALHELSYDQYHPSTDQIYRVVQTQERSEPYFINRVPRTGSTFAPLMALTDSRYSDFLRIIPTALDPFLLKSENNALYWANVVIAEENLFTFFDHQVLAGDPLTALNEPNTIAISKEMAIAYFDRQSPIGQQLFTNTDTALTVTLVYDDLPANSHLNYSAAISESSLNSLDIETMDSNRLTMNTINTFASTYFRMPASFLPASFHDTIEAMTRTYLPAIANQEGFVSRYDWYLEPLSDIHLYSLTDESGAQGNRYLVLTYMAVAGFILLVANLNFTNLSISRYSKRLPESGIHKILGASRRQLIGYFFVENGLVLILAFVLALIFIPLFQSALPLAGFLDGSISLTEIIDGKTVLFTASVIALLGMAAVLYPATILTNFPLAGIARREFSSGKLSFWIKETIVFLQFTVTTGGIACTLLMLAQMNFIQQMPLGFEVTDRIAIQIRGKENVERVPLLKEQLLTHSSIRAATLTNMLPFTFSSIATGYVETNSGERQTLPYHRLQGEPGYVETLGLDLLQGNSLEARANIQSTNAVIVNEAFVEAMEWEDPIGKILFTPGAYGLSEVVGVARNFNYLGFETGHEPIAINTLDQQAVIMRERNISLESYYRQLVVAIEEGRTIDALQHIQNVYGQFDPNSPLLYESIEELYLAETAQQSSQALLMSVFSVISTIISCTGLIGLVAFKLGEKTKELGIRKVIGASPTDLVCLQLKSTLLNVFPAALFGCVVANIVFGYWQAQFSSDYRLEPSFSSFVIATGAVIGLTLLTTSFQTLAAVSANPVRSLRYE